MMKVAAGEFELSARGHAGFSDRNDIVCAAASILFYTLASRLSQLEAEGKLEKLYIDLSKGSADVSCIPRAGFDGEISAVFRDVSEGIRLLTLEFPDNVGLKLHGG